MQETEKIWLNGELVDWADARVHVGAHGLHYGSGVFEGIRCYDTPKGPAVFRLHEHLVRLENSAKILYLELPYSVQELRAAIHELIAANGLSSCYLRPMAFYGYGELAVGALEDPATLRDFQLWLVSQAGARKKRKGVSEKTAANVIRSTLKAFARDRGLDLAAFQKLQWERYLPNRVQDPFTAEERDAILRWYHQNRPWAEYVLYRAAFDTGMRPSELLGLDVAHFDRATSSFAIRQSRYRGVRNPTKTRAAERSVELSADVAALVTELVGIKPPTAPVFPIGYGSMDKPWRRCLATLGFRPRSPYQTKHTYATLALLEGESSAVVAAKLGIEPGTLSKYYAAAIRTGQIVRRTHNRPVKSAEK